MMSSLSREAGVVSGNTTQSDAVFRQIRNEKTSG